MHTLGIAKSRRTIWQPSVIKSHQAKMVMKWLDTNWQDRMLAFKFSRGDTPLFFLFLIDPWTMTSGILQNSTPNFPLQNRQYSRERLVHFLFQVPPKKEFPWVAIRVSGEFRGPGCPPLSTWWHSTGPGVQPFHHFLGLVWIGSSLLPYGSSIIGYPQGLHQTGKTFPSYSCP